MLINHLGDVGVLAHLPDESAAVGFAHFVRRSNPDWLIDVVPAYATVGIFFDPDRISSTGVTDWVRAQQTYTRSDNLGGKTHTLPVCYEHQLDLARVAEYCELTPDDVISLHLGTEYTVYAIGFVPGFPYLGYLPEKLRGVPRLDSPRIRVEPGSVGLTGKQTGIYPLPRPGGWNLIGRTPLTLVDVADGYFPLRVGDRVRFERIDAADFDRLAGERVTVHSPSN
ncbi:MAG TPA: allophanate hydrolase subunit 1 [Fimbriiglobus sp.]